MLIIPWTEYVEISGTANEKKRLVKYNKGQEGQRKKMDGRTRSEIA